MNQPSGVTSVVGSEPEVSAPIRLVGQMNSEVLFNWLVLKRYLWMLDPKHEDILDRVTGPFLAIKLKAMLIAWKRKNGTEHPALQPPEKAPFDHLEKMLDVHFFGPTKEKGQQKRKVIGWALPTEKPEGP